VSYSKPPPTWAEVNELLACIDAAKKETEPTGYYVTGRPLPDIVREIVAELMALRTRV
jgi:hypothetical protein